MGCFGSFSGQSGRTALLIGYARVSPDDQTLDLHHDASARRWAWQALGTRGRLGGRRKQLSESQRMHGVDRYRLRAHTVRWICALTGIARSTLYALVDELSPRR